MNLEGYRILCGVLSEVPDVDGIEGFEVPPEPQPDESIAEFEITIHYEPEIITQNTKSELLLKALGDKGLMNNGKSPHPNPNAPRLECISFGVEWEAPGEDPASRTLGFRDTKAASQ